MALTHAKSGEVVNLATKNDELTEDKSSALVKTDQFEAIRLVLDSGAKMQPHRVPGQFTLQCLSGQVQLRYNETSTDLQHNDWIYLDGGIEHSVEAVEASVLLLTIML